jgi:1,4-dihydroxy-6-naphthoate synthase
LVKVLDLGEWWARETGLPLPLGVNVIRKDLPAEVQQTVARHLRASITYALTHPEEALAYAQQFGRGMGREKAGQFVGMYVNDLTADMGERGKRAIVTLLQWAAERGLVPHAPLTFVGSE